jgi:hypothetical protein
VTPVKSLFFATALIGINLSTPVFALEKSPTPSLAIYEDVGRGLGMEWFFQSNNGNPILEFGVKETDHRLDRLWEFSCTNFGSKNDTISNTIFAKSPEVRTDDQFGFSIRIDNGKSFGLIGHKGLFEIQGTQTYFPQFDISHNHGLWEALRRGERAFVNLNGNKFSIHLNGSANAINAFLNACRNRVS